MIDERIAIIMRGSAHIFASCVSMKVKYADVSIDIKYTIPTRITSILTSRGRSWPLAIFRYKGFAKIYYFTYAYISVRSNKFTCSRIMKRPNRLLKIPKLFLRKVNCEPKTHAVVSCEYSHLAISQRYQQKLEDFGKWEVCPHKADAHLPPA